MIIERAELQDVREAYLVIQPDQFKTDKEKRNKKWIKHNLDYWANQAYKQYTANKDTFRRNFELLKGKIRAADFYVQSQEVKSFMDTIVDSEVDLPHYVKHYSIMNPPINTLVGEMSKRPNTRFVKDFSDDGKAEEIQFKTQMIEQMITATAMQTINAQLAQDGQQVDQEQQQAMLEAEIEKNFANYNTLAESWANHVLKATDRYFSMKEKSEDAFRSMMITGYEYAHVFEDNSALGFNVEEENPENIWYLTTPGKKYIHRGNGSHEIGAYAAGTVKIMELSEIIEKYSLTKEEVDHLRKKQDGFGMINQGRESNLFTNKTGHETIEYDVYDPLVERERMFAEAQMGGEEDGNIIGEMFGLNSNASVWSQRFTVVQAYWISKQLVGKVTYIDEFGNEQSVEVDETYKEGSHPTEQSVEWAYRNQWYKGTKIGTDIYYCEPLKLLKRCPIIGAAYENRNSKVASIVDMMKPFQMIYNVSINQLWKLMEKDNGVVFMTTLRSIPTPKDADPMDAVDIWEEEIKHRGLIVIDDSPENMKGAPSNFNQFNRVDLSRHNEMQQRIAIAEWAKNECWELVGINRQRVGGVTASESATGTQTAMTQSYAQTEPMFVAHSYFMNDVYQTIIDAAQYIESAKPFSTIKYVSNEGEQMFIQVTGADIKGRDLFCFVTDNMEDVQNLREFRQLSQAMLQNGASAYEIAQIYSTNSMRRIEQVMEKIKQKQEAYAQNAQQMEQQQIEMQQQQLQAQLQFEATEADKDRQQESYENELDRINKKEVALLQAYGRNENALQDTDGDGSADALALTQMTMDAQHKEREFQMRREEIQNERKALEDKHNIEKEKLTVARENMKNDLQIAKQQAKNKPKPAPKKTKKK